MAAAFVTPEVAVPEAGLEWEEEEYEYLSAEEEPLSPPLNSSPSDEAHQGASPLLPYGTPLSPPVAPLPAEGDWEQAPQTPRTPPRTPPRADEQLLFFTPARELPEEEEQAKEREEEQDSAAVSQAIVAFAVASLLASEELEASATATAVVRTAVASVLAREGQEVANAAREVVAEAVASLLQADAQEQAQAVASERASAAAAASSAPAPAFSPARAAPPPPGRDAPPSPLAPSSLNGLCQARLKTLLVAANVASVLEACAVVPMPAVREAAVDALIRGFRGVVAATDGGADRLKAALRDDRLWGIMLADDVAAERARERARVAGTILEKTVADVAAARVGSDGRKTYPLGCLVSSVAWPEDDVDPSRREQSLHEDEFLELFKMDKPAFNKLPGWKQTTLRKGADLF